MDGLLESKPSVRFEVEKVIGISSDGSYQVQWAPAWVSKFHLVGCEHLIQEYLQQQSEKGQHEMVGAPSTEKASCGFPGTDHSVKLNYDKDSANVASSGAGVGSINECVNESYLHPLTDNNFESNELPSGYARINNDLPENEIGISIKDEEDEGVTEIATSPPLVYILNTEPSIPWYMQKHTDQHTTDNQAIASKMKTVSTNSDTEPFGNTENDVESNPGPSIHKGQKSKGKKYECHICMKTFKQSSHLKSHFKIHSGERPYSCSYCSASFAHKHSLNRHHRTHTRAQQPYACSTCNNVFLDKGSWDGHTCHQI